MAKIIRGLILGESNRMGRVYSGGWGGISHIIYSTHPLSLAAALAAVVTVGRAVNMGCMSPTITVLARALACFAVSSTALLAFSSIWSTAKGRQVKQPSFSLVILLTLINQMNIDVVQYSESSSKIKQTSGVIRQDMYSSLYAVSTIYLWHHSESEDLCKLTWALLRR